MRRRLAGWVLGVAGVLSNAASASAAPSPALHPEAKLSGPASTTVDHFGSCVALHGDSALIGSYGASSSGVRSGVLYVFAKTKGQWTSGQVLAPAGLTADAAFGTSCAIAEDRLVVGAPAQGGQGAAYVYALAAGTWTLEQKLVATTPDTGDHFGKQVAIDGTTIVVGAGNATPGHGAVHVFSRTTTVWSSPQKLGPDDAGAGDIFGADFAISGTKLLVGAFLVGNPRRSNVVYAFQKTGASWEPQQHLQASDAAQTYDFGYGLAIDGDVAVVGAPSGYPGSAYVFAWTGAAWTEQQKLSGKASTIAEGSSNFGSSLVLRGGALFVAEPYFENGRITAYAKGPSGWQASSQLRPADHKGETFGSTFAVSDDRLITSTDAFTPYAGHAHVFRRALDRGEPCSQATQCITDFCVDQVCCESACGGGEPTDCQACAKSLGSNADGTCGPARNAVVCRKARSECDVDDHCDGVSSTCPADKVAENGAACSSGVCIAGACSGGGVEGADGGAADPDGVAAAAQGCGMGPRPAPTVPLATLVVLVAGALVVRGARARRSD